MPESFVYREWEISVLLQIMDSIADRNVMGKVDERFTVLLILGPSSGRIETCARSPIFFCGRCGGKLFTQILWPSPSLLVVTMTLNISAGCKLSSLG